MGNQRQSETERWKKSRQSLSETTRMNDEDRRSIVDAVKHEVHAEIREMNGNPLVVRIAVFASLLVSLVTLGSVLWRAGAMSATLERVILDSATLSSRVNSVEVSATAGAREYMAKDEQRFRNQEDRLANVEKALIGIEEIRRDVAVMKTLLTEHIDRQNKEKP